MRKRRRTTTPSPRRSRSNRTPAPETLPPQPEFLSRRTPKRVTTQETDWAPVPAIMAAIFVGLVGYFIAEASLGRYPHPLHWLATAAIGLFGYAGGLIWHRAKGFN